MPNHSLFLLGGKMLTQSELKKLLHYDPLMGVFTRLGKKVGYTNIYTIIEISKVKHKAHRLAWLYMYGEFPKYQIDHINHIPTDNRICNLRDVSCQQNQRNASIRKDNKSGTCGVTWRSDQNRWIVNIRANGKQIYVGRFEKIEDAIVSRKEAEVKYGYHENHGT